METKANIEELVMVITAGEVLEDFTHELVRNQFYFTIVQSRGGFIQESYAYLLIGIPTERHTRLMEIIDKCCKPRRTYIPARMDPPIAEGQPWLIEAQIGGASVFSFDVDQFIQF